MKLDDKLTPKIFIYGDDKLAFSVVANVLKAGQCVDLLTQDESSALTILEQSGCLDQGLLQIHSAWPKTIPCQLVITFTQEQPNVKTELIAQLESRVTAETVIALNTDSIPLSELQEGARFPSRIVGLNWCYPADQTFFLEILANEQTNATCINHIAEIARNSWGKDPYTIHAGFSARGRIFAAMAREAFFLVENGIATIESVDRSCRNDAGYYLSFAGNFRYMDLMGTGGYGVVMDTLNRELATQQEVGDSILGMLKEGKTGMAAGSGFYSYNMGDLERWEELQQVFAKQIKELMEAYPITFDYESKF